MCAATFNTPRDKWSSSVIKFWRLKRKLNLTSRARQAKADETEGFTKMYWDLCEQNQQHIGNAMAMNQLVQKT
jgi:hypothetical protein